jgi:hypothetical protein
MFQTTLLATAIFTASLTPAPVAGAAPASAPQAQAAAAAAVTADQLAPFAGEWTLALQGPNGPAAMALSVRMEKDKPAADITSEAMPKQAISDFSIADKSLVMGYSFNYEGNPVSAVITMTPAATGPMQTQIDFAGGAYVMNGTATKKDKEKEKEKEPIS